MCQVHTKTRMSLPMFKKFVYCKHRVCNAHDKAAEMFVWFGHPELVLQMYQLFFFTIFISLRIVCKCNEWRSWDHNTFNSWIFPGQTLTIHSVLSRRNAGTWPIAEYRFWILYPSIKYLRGDRLLLGPRSLREPPARSRESIGVSLPPVLIIL